MFLAYIRTILLYLILIAVIRLMGKRQIGQMEPSEFVVTMLVANLAAIPIQDGEVPLLTGAVPLLTVLGLELVLAAASLRSITLPASVTHISKSAFSRCPALTLRVPGGSCTHQYAIDHAIPFEII